MANRLANQAIDLFGRGRDSTGGGRRQSGELHDVLPSTPGHHGGIVTHMEFEVVSRFEPEPVPDRLGDRDLSLARQPGARRQYFSGGNAHPRTVPSKGD